MIREYDAVYGVPRGQYYIEETTQFMDFETPEIKKITHYSRNKEELLELCRKNNWPCDEAGNGNSWSTHKIKQRGWIL